MDESQLTIFIFSNVMTLLVGFGTIWKLFIGPLLKYKKESDDWKKEMEHSLDSARKDIDSLKSTFPRNIELIEKQMNTKMERYEQLYSRFTHIESVLTEIKIALARMEERICHDKS